MILFTLWQYFFCSWSSKFMQNYSLDCLSYAIYLFRWIIEDTLKAKKGDGKNLCWSVKIRLVQLYIPCNFKFLSIFCCVLKGACIHHPRLFQMPVRTVKNQSAFFSRMSFGATNDSNRTLKAIQLRDPMYGVTNLWANSLRRPLVSNEIGYSNSSWGGCICPTRKYEVYSLCKVPNRLEWNG